MKKNSIKTKNLLNYKNNIKNIPGVKISIIFLFFQYFVITYYHRAKEKFLFSSMHIIHVQYLFITYVICICVFIIYMCKITILLIIFDYLYQYIYNLLSMHIRKFNIYFL